MKPRVFIVDDEEEFTEALAERLRMRDFDVSTALSGEEAIEMVEAYNYDVVILDVAMPGISGTETLREIKRLKPLTEVIMLTGHATVETAIEGLKIGSFDYLKKPCDTEELVEKLGKAYAKKAELEERIREARVKEIISSPRAALRETSITGAHSAPSRKTDVDLDRSKDLPLGADKSLERLIDGNKRYVDSRQVHPNQKRETRRKTKNAQHPFAVILGCSDSRVPPEIVFDQGIGDLFVVRVAGNVIDDMVLESIEYAADHLQVQLLVVLGHSGCGAVGATAAEDARDGHLQSITSAIRPALDKVKQRGGDVVDNASRANAKLVTEQLQKTSKVLSGLVEAGRLKVVPAFYDLGTGKVEVVS